MPAATSGARDHLRVWCDPIHSRYKKASVAVEIISNNVLNKALAAELRRDVRNLRVVDSVLVHDSKDKVQIQLADLLLGAVIDGWRNNATSHAKLELRTAIARHLGWPDTMPSERKFNVWYFYDPTRGPREVATRAVTLIHALPPVRSNGKSRAR